MNRKQYRVIWRCARREYHEFDRGTCMMRKDQFVSNWSVMFDPSLLSRIWDNVIASHTMGFSVADQLLDSAGNRLEKQYREDIESSFDWEGIVEYASAAEEDPGDYDIDGMESELTRVYLGSVMSIFPSGKFYMPWAMGNVDSVEVFQDECYLAALESVADKYGGSIESEDGDPTDIFFVLAD